MSELAEVRSIDQQQLFEMPTVVEGFATLTQVRGLPLHAQQTADLMRGGKMGEGRRVRIVGGVGEVVGFTYKDGKMTWTVQCDEMEFDLA